MFFRHALFGASWLLMAGCSVHDTVPQQFRTPERLAREDVRHALRGALRFLAESQIIPRAGRGSPLYDACVDGRGCRSTLPVNLPFWREQLEVPVHFPFPQVQNMEGEWASTIHPFAEIVGNASGRSPVEVQDSNMFVTANILHSLSVAQFPPDAPLHQARARAVDFIGRFRRGDGFSFWPQQASRRGTHTIVAPLNIPYAMGKTTAVLRWLPSLHDDASVQWMLKLHEPQSNPWGMESLNNIPNDADDTALALLFLPPGAPEAAPLLASMARFRDLGRFKEDGRDAWKGENSGAFLTWLKDERIALFDEPGQGIIPLGKNNVDCVVNANALLALAHHGALNGAGGLAAVEVVGRAVERRAWPACGLYYPQMMMFPYAASRAFRDGGVETLRPAMRMLLPQLLALQAEVARGKPEWKGAFPGGKDVTPDFATALGLVALLNIGSDLAVESGLQEEYSEAIENSVRFLLPRGKVWGADAVREALHWEPGLAFAASLSAIGHWRSAALTTAAVFEALAKFGMAYDREPGVRRVRFDGNGNPEVQVPD